MSVCFLSYNMHKFLFSCLAHTERFPIAAGHQYTDQATQLDHIIPFTTERS